MSNLLNIFKIVLAVHMPDEEQQKALINEIIAIVVALEPQTITSGAKLKTALLKLKKIKLTTTVKMILIHCVLESIRERLT